MIFQLQVLAVAVNTPLEDYVVHVGNHSYLGTDLYHQKETKEHL